MDKTIDTWKNGDWTTQIPEQEGWYWFYGDAFTFDLSKYCKNELYMVRVRKISNGYAYIANGNFAEQYEGFWKPADVPSFPSKPYSPNIER